MILSVLIIVILVALVAGWLVYSGPLFVRTQRRSDGVVQNYPHNAGNWEYLGLAILLALLLTTIS
jgi:hypothetical protein